MFVVGVVESVVGGEYGVDFVGQYVGYYVQCFVVFVVDQGQFVEYGVCCWWIFVFDLVFDGLDQFFFGEVVFLVVVLFVYWVFFVLV